ncbi:hypothetical protein [Lutimonas zeaxanthinifaciens]|uniref:hypothetical protein n=1 Tax=Lutimonas zeaxanthinifaciens TaxID=3060215 RepID=UPI00265CFC95|nr:hypothetical protein [Lutimonas sp. YSD2104]WKK64543.1 hypothetical protein QZH61_08030 [Lutimonas sp. YSD2104]
MVRKIIDYQKLSNNILNLLIKKFPDGYGDDDIITFKNAKGQVIQAVEIKTEDTIYLVKIGVKLIGAIEDFIEEEESNNSNNKDLDFLSTEDFSE